MQKVGKTRRESQKRKIERLVEKADISAASLPSINVMLLAVFLGGEDMPRKCRVESRQQGQI